MASGLDAAPLQRGCELAGFLVDASEWHKVAAVAGDEGDGAATTGSMFDS
jgi:hypothetical protein